MSRKRTYRIGLIFILLLWIALAVNKGFLHMEGKSRSGMNAVNENRVQTLLKGRDSFRFAVVGNVKSSMKIFEKRIVPLLKKEKVDFIISTGNAVRSGTEAQYHILERGLRRSGMPYFLTAGIGEVKDSGIGRFYRRFGPPFFTVDAGGGSFIFLDSTGTTEWDSQVQWLEEKLLYTTRSRFRFVFLGHGLTGPADQRVGESEGFLDPGKGRILGNLFDKHTVTAVFSPGNDSGTRQRFDDVQYFASGSAGGLRLDETAKHYQYLRVDVTRDKVAISRVQVPVRAGVFAHRLKTIGYFLHSFFYISLTRILLVLGLAGIAALRIYSRIEKHRKLYRDFDLDENRVFHEPVRVAMFTDNYLPYIGGVPISICRLSRGLVGKGSVVKIFAPSYGKGCAEEDNGIVYRCRSFFPGGKIQVPVTDIFSRKIKEEFERFHPDLVHVHHPFWLGSRGRKLAKKSGLPVVFTYHTRLEKLMHNVPLPGSALKEIFAHYLVRKFANGCDAVIAPGLSSEEYLRRLGVLPTVVTIPTGIDMRRYSLCHADEISAFRRRYAPNGEKLLISVCRLAREKNIDFMIDGLARVRQRTLVPFRCIIVGDGPEKERLKNRTAEIGMDGTIFFTGAMGPDEVVKAYLASDLFVFASKTETQGMVLLEAMAGGCPVVAVNASGVHDVIENGFNGYKVPEDAESWAASIVLLLENGRLMETLSASSRSFAAKYTEDRIAERVLSLYHQALALKTAANLDGSITRSKSSTGKAAGGEYVQWAGM